jgi:novobiocin biosynthesis protein NovU/D-mycarose 3-C-methyltransferase
MNVELIAGCRLCGKSELIPILELGDLPLANALKRALEEPELRYPLTLMFCPGCALVQIRETVDKTLLFSRYVWLTGTSATARRFAHEFCRNAQRVRPLAPGDLIVEVASNDGTFLRPFLDQGLIAVGVDPATNIADIANARGIPTVCAFWDDEVAQEIVARYGRAKLVVARNVVAHVSELHRVMAGFRQVLDDDGVGAVEFHAAATILDGLQYDAIYHEHLCYFSLASFERLLALHDLHPFHVDLSPISGGAYVVYFGTRQRPSSPTYRAAAESEHRAGVDEVTAWRAFELRCKEHRERSRELMGTFLGRTVVGFGASARSATYLNFCRFTRTEIAAIIDNNGLKHGHYAPGSAIPIVSASDGFRLAPDLIFLLGWNFREEILDACRERGYAGDVLVPFPNQPSLLRGTGRTA